MTRQLRGHGGVLALAAARSRGVDTLYTLSGAHVFPLYDAAVADGTPIVDVRHEATAVFAAEGTAKLTRRPGLAVLTAGPGVTNGVSAVATAHFNGVPVLVIGGRAPAGRWGSGSLQELDHPPLLAPVTKLAETVTDVRDVAARVAAALDTACAPHRGPVFLDVPIDQLFSVAEVALPPAAERPAATPGDEALAAAAAAVAAAAHPVLVLGSDVWLDGAETAARGFAERLGLPVVANGMGRGILPPGHELSVTRARSGALGRADVVVVVGAPLDFRLGFGSFGGRDGAPAAAVVHVADSEGQLARHVPLAAGLAGDFGRTLDLLAAAVERDARWRRPEEWARQLRDEVRAVVDADAGLLAADATPIHPARVYGELARQLADDAVVIGDGGDFVSFAGKYVEPAQPGRWLDPGPYGCLGTGLGYAVAARRAHPSAQVVLLLGDGAAGFSLMDVDTLVRHGLPVVMVCGNNGVWGLEKHPMRFLYGYDVAADLQPQTRYDEVVRALGGAGELVTEPDDIGPALRRAFDSGVPYLVNVVTDPDVAYPRSTTGV